MPGDIEQGYVHVKNAEGNNIKIIIIFLCSLFCLPFGITSIYFAFTDTSCVNLQAGSLYVNLKDFLAVDGLLILAYYIYIVLLIGCCSHTKIINRQGYNNILVRIFSKICAVFSLSWSIVGSIIFWSLIDNKQCNIPIYNYVFTLLILKFISIACSQMGDGKK